MGWPPWPCFGPAPPAMMCVYCCLSAAYDKCVATLHSQLAQRVLDSQIGGDGVFLIAAIA